MNFLLIPWIVVTSIGTITLAGSSYVILRSPFGSGAPVAGDVLILAIILFIAGLITTTYGGTKSARLIIGF